MDLAMLRRELLLGLGATAGAGISLHSSAPQGDWSSEPGGAPSVPVQRLGPKGAFSDVTLRQLPLGGGGFVTGLDLALDGSLAACRTDVANAYVRGRSESWWRPLFSPQTLSPADLEALPKDDDKADGAGVSGIAIAPSDSRIVYAGFKGFVWKSIDAGTTVRRTAFPRRRMLSNAGRQRLANPTIAVHPDDPERVSVGTWGEGLLLSEDGGARWRDARLPTSGRSFDDRPGLVLTCWDRSRARRLFAFVNGIGLFSSKGAAGSDFVPVAGGPAYATEMISSPDGELWLCETKPKGAGRLWCLEGDGSWRTAYPGLEQHSLAIDPFDPQHLITAYQDGIFYESRDGGRTFEQLGWPAWGNGEVAWTRRLARTFPSQCRFDPVQRGQLWVAQGNGVAVAGAKAGKLRIADRSAGIEELCVVSVLAPPGGVPIAAAWDKPFWRVESDNSYRNDFSHPIYDGGTHNSDLVAYASFTDFARDDSRFLVGIVAPSKDAAPGFSIDGGRSWNAFKGTPKDGWGMGGCIAVSNRENIVLLPSNNAPGAFTLDGGKTWEPLRLDGTNVADHFANAYYVRRKNIAADKSREGVFALVYTIVRGNSLDNPLGGVWVTIDGGRTWRQTLKGLIGTGSRNPDEARLAGLDERQFWQCELSYVPGRAGNLLYTAHADRGGDRFFWSRDDGASWAEPWPDIRRVKTFAFGKGARTGANPAVYFWGAVGREEGLFVSTDWFASPPVHLAGPHLPLLGGVTCLAASPDGFGQVFMGTSCTGVSQLTVNEP